MDFIDGYFGKIFYTEKELKLHVHGDCAVLPIVKETHDGISAEEKESFLQDGFLVLRAAVPQNSVDDARRYINSQYPGWWKRSKRQDDWRCHLMTDLRDRSQPVQHARILQLLLSSPALIQCIEDLTHSSISGIFYSQIALRTPLPSNLGSQPAALDYCPGAQYHLDGQANSSGTRFPDPWTLLVGVALVDVVTEDMGNFTVFPGWHRLRDWSRYPDEKRTKTLPDLGAPTHVCLRAGDAVVAHVLLPHRGGKNTTSACAPVFNAAEHCTSVKGAFHTQGCAPATCPLESPWHIPANSREMVFFRVRVEGVDYEAPGRAARLLGSVWSELPGIEEHILANVGAGADTSD